MQVPITVVYLDNSGKAPEDTSHEMPCDTHEFKPEAADVDDMPHVLVLYRPGHYDILYRE
jgi:ubiquitin thioesterase protein OTUB1